MRMQSARLVALAAAGAIAAFSVIGVHASDYPERPVTIVVPFGAGSVTDVIVRQVAQRLSEELKKPFVIDNRPGANGVIGYGTVARAKPDGHVLGGTMATFVTNRYLVKNVPYDEFRDFAPVATIARTPMILVAGPSVKAKDLSEFKSEASVHPEAFTYASTSGSNRLNVELLKKRLNISVQDIPYRDANTATTDVIAGRISIILAPLNTAIPLMTSGQLRPLAILSGERHPAAPDVPTAKELGLGDIDIWSWQGLLAPAGTPENVVEMLHRHVNRALNEPAFKARLQQQGYQSYPLERQQFSSLIRDEIEAYGKVANEVGIAPE
jgi:tripartite-type tricarboxylate transporter receptor subunit TctC